MSIIKPITIGIVAGETSGDILGAGLIHALRCQLSNLRFVGIAVPRMQAAGMETWFDMEELTVMGFVETVTHFYQLLSIRR